MCVSVAINSCFKLFHKLRVGERTIMTSGELLHRIEAGVHTGHRLF